MKMSLAIAACFMLPLILSTEAESQASKKSFRFANQEFVHRFTKGSLTEFTPKTQPDLKKWSEMITVNTYSDAKTGEALAERANTVLTNYQRAKAIVVRTDSKPRTASKPAEHLIVVLFPQPDFIEAAYARFVMHKGVGVSIVYSHRIYGKKAGDAMSAWLKANGEKREKELMALAGPPK